MYLKQGKSKHYILNSASKMTSWNSETYPMCFDPDPSTHNKIKIKNRNK